MRLCQVINPDRSWLQSSVELSLISQDNERDNYMLDMEDGSTYWFRRRGWSSFIHCQSKRAFKKPIDLGSDECLPSCRKTIYESVAIKREISKGFDKNVLLIQYPRLIKETLTQKDEYSWEEALGFIGGTIGLMSGMSLLSVIEIILLVLISVK